MVKLLTNYTKIPHKIANNLAATLADKGPLHLQTRMQFDRLPHPVFNELIQKTSQEYLSSLAEIESQSLLLQKTADLLLLAPDSCMETGKL